MGTLLGAMGIESGQGFHFGRPEPVEQFLSGLEEAA